ncbi:MAG: hypothetical protein ACREHD_24745, partial [Pirellulales bacterium]
MSLDQLRDRLFGTSRAARRFRQRGNRAARRPCGTPLTSERLEDRVVLSGVTITSGMTINVANGDVAGLISAITTANADGQPTTIVLATNGVYDVSSIDNTVTFFYGTTANGLPQITGNVTIDGNGATLERSSAAGTPAFRLLDLQSGELTLNNLTIANGEESRDALPAGSWALGGGILDLFASSLTLNGVTLQDNSVIGSTGAVGGTGAGGSTTAPNKGGTGGDGGIAEGGALYDLGGSVTIINSQITSNSATGGGGGTGGDGLNLTNSLGEGYGGDGGNGGLAEAGGVYAFGGTLTINNSTIAANSAVGGPGGQGGAPG